MIDSTSSTNKHIAKNNQNSINLKNKGDSFMSSFKKSLALLVAFVMVFALMTPALAATPEDVIGTPYENSVGKLNALGVLAGYPDGSFKPEQNITRAEFAKIAVYTLGLQNAADLAKGSTSFKDVKADHWASGYINIAAERKLIQGYPDKTFKPSSNVSNAEALTILVRAIGMGPVVEGKGTWPSNYLAKASEVGLTKDVSSVDGKTAAIRGNISIMSWNSLTAEKWGEKEYTSTGITYGPLGKTLLEEQFSDYVYKDSNGKYVPKVFEDVEVVGTQLVGGLSENEVQLKSTDIATKLNITATSDTPRKVDANNIIVEAEGLDTIGLLGKKVDVMFGKDNKLMSFKVKSSVAQSGVVDEFKSTDNKVKIAGKEYTMAASSNIYANTKNYATLALAETAIAGAKANATAVLDSTGKISTLDLFVADTNAALGQGSGTTQFIVKEVRSNSDVISLQSGSKVFGLDDITGVNSSKKAIIVKNGKTATKADIKAGDAVTYIEVNTGSLYYVVASDNKVTGQVSMISPDSNGTYKLTINGTQYAMTKDTSARMTKDGTIDNKIAVDSTVTDFQGKDVTATLNANGDIVFISGSVTASATEQYGILTKAIWESTSPDANGKLPKFMEVRTAAGDKKVFTVKGDKYKTATTTVPTSAATDWALDGSHNETNMVAGTLVQYKVDADGTVNAANLVKVQRIEAGSGTENPSVTSLATKTDSIYVNVTSVNNDAKSIVAGGVYYYYTADSTTIYNANTNTAEKYLEKVDGWDAIANSSTDKLSGNNVYIVYNTETKIIKTIVADINAYLTSTDKYGVVTQTQFSGLDADGSAVWKIKVYSDGAETTYTVANGVYDTTVAPTSNIAVTVGDFVKFTLDGDGKFDGGANASAQETNFLVDKSIMVTNEDGNYDDSIVKSVVGNLITFNEKNSVSRAPVSVKSDVKVYDISGATPTMASMSDITAGTMIKEVNLDNGQYKIIVIVRK